MGGTCSQTTDVVDDAVPRDFKILASQTPFTEAEIELLFELYKKLSSSITRDGYIHKEEFQLAFFRNGKQKNLFLSDLFVLFDVDGNGHIEFGEFVRSLGIFHPKAPREAKIKYAFQLYDLRHTGFIEREEDLNYWVVDATNHTRYSAIGKGNYMIILLKELVLALLQESDLVLDDEVVGIIVDKTFTEADTKRDNRIDEDEWREYVEKNPSMLKNMTLPYLIDINQAFPSFVLNTDAKQSYNR